MAGDDPKDRTHRDLARLREAINNKTHWLFATDDPAAALTLRNAADSDAVFVEVVMCFADRGDVFPLAILAVSKRAWPPSAALRVAAAASGGRGPRPDSVQVRDGADCFPISRDPERLTVVWELIRRGAISTEPPGGR